MESDGEDLDNIFEDYDAAENDNVVDNTENAQTENETSKVKIPVPKRIVKNPRLKFNPERLCGERGIPTLIDHFKDVKFKGPGYEREDLDKLMSRLEHWTHRLFPSMKFEDCLNQIEKLGKKRPVQTCLRKIRLDMPILSKDFIQGDEEDHVQRNDDPEPAEIDPFDRLVEESQHVGTSNVSISENSFESNSFYSSPALNSTPKGQLLGSSNESSLSEEQKQRMERNRMLAAERRKARLAAIQQNSLDLQPASHDDYSSENNQNSEIFFDTLLKNSENSQNDIHNSTSKMDTENSENLGLEDLIDLVDEEEPVVQKRNLVSQGLEDLVDLVDEEEPVVEKRNSESLGLEDLVDEEPIVEKRNSESLGLDDLVDLVDDEEPVVQKSNLESQRLDDFIDLVDDEEHVKEKQLTQSYGVDKSNVLSFKEQSNVEKDSSVLESRVSFVDEEISSRDKNITLTDDECKSDVLVIDEEPFAIHKESTLSDDMHENDVMDIDEEKTATESESIFSDDSK